jgi:hypothetical protein
MKERENVDGSTVLLPMAAILGEDAGNDGGMRWWLMEGRDCA